MATHEARKHDDARQRAFKSMRKTGSDCDRFIQFINNRRPSNAPNRGATIMQHAPKLFLKTNLTSRARALAEELDVSPDFVDELLEQIRPARISPKAVMQHRVGRFQMSVALDDHHPRHLSGATQAFARKPRVAH